MLKSDSKAYCVYEYGGEYEDKWRHIIGVCSTLELAEELKADKLANRSKGNISDKELEDMLTYIYENYETYGYWSVLDELKQVFPNKDPEDIDIAYNRYYDDFRGINIEEVNFYGTNS